MIEQRDEELIQEYVYTDLLVRVLERDMLAIHQSCIKLKIPYTEWIGRHILHLRHQLQSIKQAMLKTGIKLHSEAKQEALFVSYNCIVRGYERTYRYGRDVMKMEVTKRLLKMFEVRYEKL
ncbi:hypothetical protein [Bacillus sp. 165]|uniref:hypothetical protein n=1 Tax=Bacillus sp. 165 TaxID=1529117 RepID=UPI001ADA68B4|nr:hypothetical protein [Bacillus sp. 165]MBO9130434.1 hypothetical protein [Bacillus sp. 165]